MSEYLDHRSYGGRVHPDDYSSGEDDLVNIMREESRDYAQEVADYHEHMEWLVSAERFSDYFYACRPLESWDGVGF